MRPPWTDKSDSQADKKTGLKENSKKDFALDKKRGVPEMPKMPKMPMMAKMPKMGSPKAAPKRKK